MKKALLWTAICYWSYVCNCNFGKTNIAFMRQINHSLSLYLNWVHFLVLKKEAIERNGQVNMPDKALIVVTDLRLEIRYVQVFLIERLKWNAVTVHWICCTANPAPFNLFSLSPQTNINWELVYLSAWPLQSQSGFSQKLLNPKREIGRDKERAFGDKSIFAKLARSCSKRDKEGERERTFLKDIEE